MVILNECEYAEKCLRDGVIDTKPFNTLSILAKYYYHHCGFKKKKIVCLLLEFLKKYYPRYELDELSWRTTVEKIAANAGKYQLFEISGVKISKKEMAVIERINDKVLERLAFTMLCLAKLSDIKYPQNNGWVNISSKDIFKYARISCTSAEREIKIGKLWRMELLEFSKRNDNLNCRVTFIDNNSDESLFVSDFRELGYEYKKYKGEPFVHCAECGILIRANKNGTKKYCKDCGAYTPQKIRKIICVDCGNEFEVNARVVNKTRCSICQNAKIKEDTKKRVQKLRDNRKM